MHISFSPQRRMGDLVVSKAGDVLTINGEAFDFSAIPEGAILPAEAVACEFVVGNVERISGELHVTLLLPHGTNPSASVAFPADLMAPADGAIPLPTDEASE